MSRSTASPISRGSSRAVAATTERPFVAASLARLPLFPLGRLAQGRLAQGRVPLGLVAVGLLLVGLLGCENAAKKSVERATPHVTRLVETMTNDVAELERGMPRAAPILAAELFPREKVDADAGADAGKKSARSPLSDPQALKRVMERVRSKDADLRLAKSTFFAVAKPDGTVLRNDQQQDLMAGRGLFGAYPELKQALTSKTLVRSRGSLAEAAGVRGRPDAQWVVASALREAGEPDGAVKGLYVSGWSWSSYAYRLENALKSWIDDEHQAEKEPVVYAFVLVDGAVYGAPIAPEANIEAIAGLKLLEGLAVGATATRELELSGRAFGVVAQRVPALGEGVGVAILRTET